jgi:hypothetical protein
MKRAVGIAAALAALAVIVTIVGSAAARPPLKGEVLNGQPTGDHDFGGREFGQYITECPQAKLASNIPRGLDRRDVDRVEQLSNRGDDLRGNYDQACVPQNETSIAVNPRHTKNLVGGANDYQGDYNSFFATPDRGKSIYGSVDLNPSTPLAYNLTHSDPVFIYDSDGVAYNQEIAFAFDDANGVFVWRSTNGGFTWSRPCVAVDATPGDPTDEAARCGGTGDPRQPGDGTITWNADPTPGSFEGDIPFDDKNWMAAGPRPTGVSPQCFSPLHRTPVACNPAVVGSDRLYATWTRFDTSGCAEDPIVAPCEGRIWLSYSDDQARSWSPPKPISGSAAFCIGIGPLGPNACDDNQFSVPTVHPRTGLLGVAFQNFNTPHESQYMFVRSGDGGQTFQGPFHVTPVFDANYPRGATRPDCRARGQSSSRQVLTNNCFRVNSAGNVVIDKRDGAFADDFYLVMSDNRNGTAASSNTDVFFFRSTNGGSTWVGPTRINDDRSALTVSRDCGTGAGCGGDFGNDQWFPWIDVDARGVLGVAFYDRRFDEDSQDHAWPTSRQRPGNYLTWRFGAGCRVSSPTGRQCLASGAAEIPQPTAPVNPGADPVPGQGPSFLGPFANSVLSDVPSNMDYSFRTGLFMGDYDVVAYPNFPQLQRGDGDNDAIAVWTDARNGRGSGAPTSFQAGRNPPCEHADVFFDYFDPLRRDLSDAVSESEEELFLITPCPGDTGRGNGDNDDD